MTRGHGGGFGKILPTQWRARRAEFGVFRKERPLPPPLPRIPALLFLLTKEASVPPGSLRRGFRGGNAAGRGRHGGVCGGRPKHLRRSGVSAGPGPDAGERTRRLKMAAAAGWGCSSAPSPPRILPACTRGPVANTARLARSAPPVFIARVGRAPPLPAGPTPAEAPAGTRGPRVCESKVTSVPARCADPWHSPRAPERRPANHLRPGSRAATSRRVTQALRPGSEKHRTTNRLRPLRSLKRKICSVFLRFVTGNKNRKLHDF